MFEVKFTQSQHDGATSAPPAADDPPLWRSLLAAHVRRRKQWLAHGDLLAEQLAAQGGATLRAGLHLWAEALRVGVDLGRSSVALGRDTLRRSLEISR